MRCQTMIQDRRRHSLDAVHAKPDGMIGLEKMVQARFILGKLFRTGRLIEKPAHVSAGAKPRVAGPQRFLQNPLQHGDHAIRVERSALQMSFVLG